jgi:hypothetical protein
MNQESDDSRVGVIFTLLPWMAKARPHPGPPPAFLRFTILSSYLRIHPPADYCYPSSSSDWEPDSGESTFTEAIKACRNKAVNVG